MDYKNYHEPVLLNQLMAHFQLRENAIVFDGTMGFAGHAEAILQSFPNTQYVGFDKDIDAIKIAKGRCASFKNVSIVNAPFSSMFNYMTRENVMPTHILLDLGVSSFQIDQSNRGFTFQKNEPLDMRMDHYSKVSAKEILDTYNEDDLIALFETEGDIKHPNKLVAEILSRRQHNELNTTFDLVECVKRGVFVNSRRQFIAMCTKVFQAIRIEVNGEMEELRQCLDRLLEMNDVVVAIITFQPNEDKLVKSFIKEHQLNRINKKPIQASYHECKKNPRERTAKLRIFQI